jgi:glyoxylase-like metal-dependent hydrolase (beta-lactamase superfamily II)
MHAIRTTGVSRRDFLAAAGALGVAASLHPRSLAGAAAEPRGLLPTADGPVQQIRLAAARDPVRVQHLRGNVSVLSGSGGNVVALVAARGIVLIESGVVGPKIAAALASLGSAPVTHVVNTHWHFDHTEANAWMQARGAAIIAHENTRKRLSVATRVQDWDFTFPASPAGALPTITVTEARRLRLHAAVLALEPYAPAHTDSDLSVHLTDEDVLHVGDTWWNGAYPFIDYSTGGSLAGTIRAAEENLRRVSARTIVVPGHGVVGGRVDVARFLDMLVAIRTRVATLKTQGRTASEVVAAKPTAAFDAAWSGGPIGPDFFARLVYKGV